MPRRREEVVLIGLAVAMGVVLLVALTVTRSGRDAPPPPDDTTSDDVCARCRDVTRAHSSNMWTPRDNAAGCSLAVQKVDGVLSTACTFHPVPPQDVETDPQDVDTETPSNELTEQTADYGLELHKAHIQGYVVSLPRCANHADDPSKVTCCMTRVGDDDFTCPRKCFHEPVIDQDGGEVPLSFEDITAKMKAGPAACFQSLDVSTGLIQ